MKKISKQLLSLMLVFAFVFVSVPITANAASKVETITLKAVEGLTYYDQDGFEFSEADNDIYQEDYSYTITIDPSSGDITFTASNGVIPNFAFGIGLAQDKEISITHDASRANYTETTATNPDRKVYEFNLNTCRSTAFTITPVVAKAPHTVKLPSDPTTQYELSAYGAQSVEDGGNYSFDLTVYSEYSSYLPVVRVGGAVLNHSSVRDDEMGNKIYGYTIEAVTKDLNVAVSLNAPVIVTLPSGSGYKAESTSGSNLVAYGGSFTFTVTVEEGYGAPAVASNGIAVEPVQTAGSVYTYQLDNVRQTQNVSVAISKRNHTITVQQQGDGFTTTADPSTVLEYGSSYSFTVAAAQGYNEPAVTVTTGSPSSLKQSGNTYTINRVTEDFAIQITGGGKLSSQITFNNGEGYTVLNPVDESVLTTASVEYGSAYTFWVKLNEGYTQSDLNVTANNIKLNKTAVEHKDNVYAYTIPAVQAAQVVSVSNVMRNTYKATLIQGDGYTLTANTTSVQHGDSFEFSLAVDPAYNSASAVVKSTGANQPVYNAETKTYSVTVTEDISISVEGLTPNQYKVSYTQSAKEYSISTSSSTSVGYNGSFTFAVEVNPGYILTAVNAVSNGVVSPLNTIGNNSYVINNITADQSIQIVTAKASYTVSYVDAKGNGAGTAVYTVDSPEVNAQTGEITLKTPSAKNYLFVEWQDGTGTGVKDLALGNENKEITLTANWEVDWENLFTVQIGLDENGWNDTNGKYSIRLVIPWAADNIEELAGAKIVRSGVFYSNQQIADKHDNNALKGYIGQYAVEGAGHKSVQIGSNPLFLYYTQYTTPFTDINGQFTQSFTGIKPGQARYATAWVEVEVNGVRYTYFSEQWNGTAPAPAA